MGILVREGYTGVRIGVQILYAQTSTINNINHGSLTKYKIKKNKFIDYVRLYFIKIKY